MSDKEYCERADTGCHLVPHLIAENRRLRNNLKNCNNALKAGIESCRIIYETLWSRAHETVDYLTEQNRDLRRKLWKARHEYRWLIEVMTEEEVREMLTRMNNFLKYSKTRETLR